MSHLHCRIGSIYIAATRKHKTVHFSETSDRLSSHSIHITGHMLGNKEKKRKIAETSPETALKNGDAHNDAGSKKRKPRHPKSAEKLAAK